MPRGNLPIPTEPMLHTLTNGQSVIRYMGKNKKGSEVVRNLAIGTVDDAEGERLLEGFTRELKTLHEKNGVTNGHAKAPKSTKQQRAKWAKQARDKRAKSKGGKIPRVAPEATETGTAVAVIEPTEHNVHQRSFYAKRKEQAEAGKASVEAVRRINEHVG